jgi:hypothetical protein
VNQENLHSRSRVGQHTQRRFPHVPKMASDLFAKLKLGPHSSTPVMDVALIVLIAVHVVAFAVWIVLTLRAGSKRKPATKAD